MLRPTLVYSDRAGKSLEPSVLNRMRACACEFYVLPDPETFMAPPEVHAFSFLWRYRDEDIDKKVVRTLDAKWNSRKWMLFRGYCSS